jgi:hypothetical protein
VLTKQQQEKFTSELHVTPLMSQRTCAASL